VEIVNAGGAHMAQRTVPLPYGWNRSPGNARPMASVTEGNSFDSADPYKITNNLTLKITSSNGSPAAQAAREKRITILAKDEYSGTGTGAYINFTPCAV
jgi:hypothetical protein